VIGNGSCDNQLCVGEKVHHIFTDNSDVMMLGFAVLATMFIGILMLAAFPWFCYTKALLFCWLCFAFLVCLFFLELVSRVVNSMYYLYRFTWT